MIKQDIYVIFWTSLIEDEPPSFEARLCATVELEAHASEGTRDGPFAGPPSGPEFNILQWQIKDSTNRYVVIPQRVLEALVDYSQLEIIVKNEANHCYKQGVFG